MMYMNNVPLSGNSFATRANKVPKTSPAEVVSSTPLIMMKILDTEPFRSSH